MLDAPDQILRLRLANQHLVQPSLSDPTRLVAHLGAVQSQDFNGALWGLGQRLCDATGASVERAFAEGAFVRTHVMRPTWHFVAAADIRWLLALTAPRVKATLASNDRLLGLDADVIARSNAALTAALAGGRHLTRPEIDLALRGVGIEASTAQTLGHLMAHAELDAIVCSGPRRGKQFTYALFDERVPAARAFDVDTALAELTRRYFTSHGPATVRDCAWWSGLTVASVRRGLELNGSLLERETVEGLTYFFAGTAGALAGTSGGVAGKSGGVAGKSGGVAGRSAEVPPMPARAYLLPNYDEYLIAYRDRDLFYDRARAWTPDRRDEAPFGNVFVIAGRVAGMWRKTVRTDGVTFQLRWFNPPSPGASQAVNAAAQTYAAFVGAPVTVENLPAGT